MYTSVTVFRLLYLYVVSPMSEFKYLSLISHRCRIIAAYRLWAPAFNLSEILNCESPLLKLSSLCLIQTAKFSSSSLKFQNWRPMGPTGLFSRIGLCLLPLQHP